MTWNTTILLIWCELETNAGFVVNDLGRLYLFDLFHSPLVGLRIVPYPFRLDLTCVLEDKGEQTIIDVVKYQGSGSRVGNRSR